MVRFGDIATVQHSVIILLIDQSKYSFVYFFFRVEAYIRNGWAKDIIDPDGIFTSQQQGVSLSTSDCGLPEIDANAVWKPQKEAFLPSNPINFTNAETVNYFVLRSTTDGMPASDVKQMSKSALNLFRCGHLQEINNLLSPTRSCLHQGKLHTRNEKGSRLQTYVVFG